MNQPANETQNSLNALAHFNSPILIIQKQQIRDSTAIESL